MTVSTVGNDAPASSSKPRNYWIRLKIASADREDAWELCRVALHHGGAEIGDGCFAFATQEQWLTVWEALRFRFGSEYFEAVESTETHPD